MHVTRYTIIHGQCLSVGVSGYLLGGGVNALGASARHGFGAQNVISMKVRCRLHWTVAQQ